MKINAFTSCCSKLLVVLCILSFPSIAKSQDCKSSIAVVLRNMEGGFYANQKVTFTPKSGGKATVITSDSKGEVKFTSSCNSVHTLTISNYTKTKEIILPEFNGTMATRTLSYDPNMLQKEKDFAMTSEESSEVDRTASSLPDTTFITGASMAQPKLTDHFTHLTITLKDIQGKPLIDEMVILSGLKRKKNFKGITNKLGVLSMYIPKGDQYTINFKYNRGYSNMESTYARGTENASVSLMYLGTREIEKRKKEEALRIAEEEKRLKAEEERFKAYCKSLGISPEEGRKLELESYYSNPSTSQDTVVSAVLNRNKWDNKLIVCDLTGSMAPYSSQLALWYALHMKKEQNLQFVFFNDGDAKNDADKVIGSTGGIYYSKADNLDKLKEFCAMVAGAGSGGDCPENNMEALIKGVRMASPYKELVMIVDNHAPVKDLKLLKDFNTPVHIVLCGADDHITTDYLMIAWKTKGSIHTIEEDITKIATMMEGQELKIKGRTFRIMGGEFVLVTKS